MTASCKLQWCCNTWHGQCRPTGGACAEHRAAHIWIYTLQVQDGYCYSSGCLLYSVHQPGQSCPRLRLHVRVQFIGKWSVCAGMHVLVGDESTTVIGLCNEPACSAAMPDAHDQQRSLQQGGRAAMVLKQWCLFLPQPCQSCARCHHTKHPAQHQSARHPRASCAVLNTCCLRLVTWQLHSSAGDGSGKLIGAHLNGITKRSSSAMQL
jgi:hypothetical protein